MINEQQQLSTIILKDISILITLFLENEKQRAGDLKLKLSCLDVFLFFVLQI